MPTLVMSDEQIAHVCEADNPTDLIVRFWRDVALPTYGESWDDFKDGDIKPWHYALPETQWKLIADHMLQRWGSNGGLGAALMWMNVGPGSIDDPAVVETQTR